MNNVINRLYYGEICPCEKPAPNTKRYTENRKLICSTEEQLLDTYTDALHIEAQLECEADFERGFRLGAELMLEVIKD